MNTLTSPATDFLLAIRAARQGTVPMLPAIPLPSLPFLEDVLAMSGHLPADSLFFGLASDGLPLIFNLREHSSGSVLVLGDGGAGKTAFLKVVARSMMITGQPENMSYAVITPRPEEWGGWDGQPNCLGIWHSQASRVGDLFFDLAAWAENPQKTGNTVLLIDDLGSLAYLNRHDLECLYWLFRYGPAGHVRALVTLNSEYSRDLPNWLNMFRTRVFGHISDPLLEEELTPIPESRLHKLLPGAQFCIKEGQEWLRFWLPLVVDETNRRFV